MWMEVILIYQRKEPGDNLPKTTFYMNSTSKQMIYVYV